ncbi:hypothetical protein BKI52_04920 [marine bacterium AO1-C]|nr:hypothetical protein BKI52_04920 [marine bacterium AO1-C]
MFYKVFICLCILLHNGRVFSQLTQKPTNSEQKESKDSIANVQKAYEYLKLLKQRKPLDSNQQKNYIEQLVQLIKQEKNQALTQEAYWQLGQTATQNKQYKQAIKWYKKYLKLVRQDSKKLGKVLFRLGQTSLKAHQLAKANEYFQQTIVLYEREKLPDKLLQVLNKQGQTYGRQGKYQIAARLYRKALRISISLGKKKSISIFYNNLGIAYKNLGAYIQALDAYYKSLTIKQKFKPTKKTRQSIAATYNNLGIIYKLQGETEKALEFYKKGLTIRLRDNKQLLAAHCYNNIAEVYFKQQKHQLALEYYLKSLAIKTKENDLKGICSNYGGMGQVYVAQKDETKGLECFQKALSIAQSIQSTPLMVDPLLGIGNIYYHQKNYPNALKYFLQGMTAAKKTDSPIKVKEAASLLADVYEITGKHQKALKNHRLFKKMADKLLNEENTKTIARLEAQFEFKQEKDSLQNINHTQNIELEKKAIAVRFQRNINILVVFLLLITAAFAVSYYRGQRKEKKLNIVLTSQKEEILQSQEEIASQRDILEKKNDILSIYQRRIRQSFRAAQLIQQSILPSSLIMQQFFNDYFIFYLPKDVVSGDFYWIDHQHNKLILVVADCTGHGVPGAFMTLIGSKLLDKIIKTNKVTSPQKILHLLNMELDNTLNSNKQETDSMSIVAGMDASVIYIEPQNLQFKITFAGAKNRLMYFDAAKNELGEIRGTRKSIGGYQDVHKPYNETELMLPKDSVLYLGSDGLADQNNNLRKRFGWEMLKTILERNAHMPLDQQKELLVEAFQQYQQGEEQRDDILWMGLML